MSWTKRGGMVLALGLLSASLSSAATLADCQAFRHHGRFADAQTCYESLTQSKDPYLRAEGLWGVQAYQDANNAFRLAVSQSDGNALYRVRWGRLLHERFNNTDAEKLFQEALMRDPKNAQAYLGLALISADGFDDKAIEYATKAISLDPKLVEAHELMANLLLEDSDPDHAAMEADAALSISSEALDAMAIHAAIEVLSDRSPDEWIGKIRAVNPNYGEGYALIAHHLVINRRYTDGIAYYRKAIEADPKLWSARSELGINLMRLGQEDEPRQQLELCYDNGYRNAATVNSLKLLDSYKDFVTYRDDDTILRLKKKEADLLYPYFEPELKKIIATYTVKYKMKLPAPVQVEVYPDHDDFAVRTMGMPGLGALGVTFNEVVAMDSPSGRKPGDYHWGSTLWHEMSHVFILTATNSRVPRWFTEGLAVHEETQASPEWGDRVTPEILVAIRDRKLLPISDLDRGFIRPEYPDQVLVSYFEAGRICDYIQERWGADKLLDMVHSYADLKTTPEAIKQNFNETPQQFDRDFDLWLAKQYSFTAANFDDWRTKLKELIDLARNKQYDDVLAKGAGVRAMYPEYIGPGNAYEFMAEADVAKGDKKAAVAILADYKKNGGENPDTLKELAGLQVELGDTTDAAATLDAVNYIYPEDEDLHHRLGDLWFEQHNYTGAIREYTAVVNLHPIDKATAQYNVARAYLANKQPKEAQEHILASLEAAPDFRPAQKLLLQLDDTSAAGTSKAPPTSNEPPKGK